ncbi:MAG: phytoene/squalene synthase family protein [Candidatus Kryptoniota bacterium]
MSYTSRNSDRLQHLKLSMKWSREMTRVFSKGFYLSTFLMPSDLRRDVFALYGYCRYTDNIGDSPRERSAKEIVFELNCWREELKSAYKSGESQHPVMNAFVHVAIEKGIPIQLPLELIDGVQSDIQSDSYADFIQLRKFCYQVASVVGLMMTRVIGYRDEAAFQHAESLGIAMQLTNILRDINEDWQLRRKIFLPEEDLMRFGVTRDDIAAGVVSEKFVALMKFEIERARGYYQDAQNGINLLSKRGRSSIRAAADIYSSILTEIEKRNHDVFSSRPVVSLMRKISIMARHRFLGVLPIRSEAGDSSLITGRTKQIDVY